MNHTDDMFHKDILQETLQMTKRSSSLLLTPTGLPHELQKYGDNPGTSRGEGSPLCDLLTVPSEILHIIFGHITFDQLTRMREVCRKLDREASHFLNQGYFKFGESLEKARAQVKRELPKRESERRTHHLSKLADVYAALDTRKALLDMTYKKYIDRDVTCFIPGKVIDEGFRLLSILQRCKASGGVLTGDTCELLRDMRDLSSMAMEHFEDTIEPRLKGMRCSRWSGNAFKTVFQETPLFKTNELSAAKNNTKSSASCWRTSMQEKIREQEHVIQKQNEIIEQLRIAVTQIANYVEMPLDLRLTRITNSENEMKHRSTAPSTKRLLPDDGTTPTSSKRARIVASQTSS